MTFTYDDNETVRDDETGAVVAVIPPLPPTLDREKIGKLLAAAPSMLWLLEQLGESATNDPTVPDEIVMALVGVLGALSND